MGIALYMPYGSSVLRGAVKVVILRTKHDKDRKTTNLRTKHEEDKQNLKTQNNVGRK
jgi:hypothetical protein